MNQSKFDRQVEAGAETFIKGVGDGIKKMVRAPNLILGFILITLVCGVLFIYEISSWERFFRKENLTFLQ